ncbi:MAG: methylmalonyl Co-A mutase-associated GTPase MeaB [Alphaproteobacteria bacterium]|nr:methylmalonyl Co-A mutase-associated GTPase MeaB [Alphaproteobacteria bacterium]
MLDTIKRNGKTALARALGELERSPDGPASLDLLDAAYAAPRAHVLGVTGPPGVGKSTLLNALIAAWRGEDRTVGVIAVDPSSRRSGGALLGDRTRIKTAPGDDGVYVRSMAARDRLGGLAGLTWPATVLMRALYDAVVVETVGVGQSEGDVADTTDTVVLCIQPGAGDSLQFMKAGIIEIPDIVVVTKGDLGAPAARTESDARGALDLSGVAGGWAVPVMTISATQGTGLDRLIATIDDHRAYLTDAGRLAALRRRQAENWLSRSVEDAYGREGLIRAGPLALSAGQSPFRRRQEIVTILRG